MDDAEVRRRERAARRRVAWRVYFWITLFTWTPMMAFGPFWESVFRPWAFTVTVPLAVAVPLFCWIMLRWERRAEARSSRVTRHAS